MSDASPPVPRVSWDMTVNEVADANLRWIRRSPAMRRIRRNQTLWAGGGFCVAAVAMAVFTDDDPDPLLVLVAVVLGVVGPAAPTR